MSMGPTSSGRVVLLVSVDLPPVVCACLRILRNHSINYSYTCNCAMTYCALCTYSTELATSRSKHATTNMVLLSCVVLVLQPLYANYWRDIRQHVYVRTHVHMCMLAYNPQPLHQSHYSYTCYCALTYYALCTYSTERATSRNKHATTNLVLLSCVVLVSQPLYASYWKDMRQHIYVCANVHMCCIAYCDFVYAELLVSPRSCQQSMTVCRVCSRLRITYFLKAFVAGPTVQPHGAPTRPLRLYKPCARAVTDSMNFTPSGNT